ncbi:MAG TPA: aminoacyl-tRNA hydrolase [Candidatus Limnocylindrales bacterium]|nr:aminoacyl-tRNA hydrolase [Candidatus Limnocylindrales bacterium]
MKIVIGLGNPGQQYDRTRHNVGWMVLDRLAERAGWTGHARARDAAASVHGRYGGLDLMLVKPTTYMNLSGVAVRKVLARQRAPLDDVLVVVDDFALPLGRLRLRERGSAGSHNGLRSIVAEMGSEKFARLRVGIGAPVRDGDGGMARAARDHVLSRFDPSEETLLEQVLEAAADAVEEWARSGISTAANRWNAWQPPAALRPDDRPGADARAGEPAARDTGDEQQPPQPDEHGIVRRRTGWRKLLGRPEG